MSKQYSAACERNREPILHGLRAPFAACKTVLEIGSGTGQHAIFFGAQLPHLFWQTSDLPANHAGILAWQADANLPNVLPPLPLDMRAPTWPSDRFDAVFTANTCHIMAWKEVQKMIAGVGQLLAPGGLFALYGPFNYGRSFTSAGNAAFDASLRAQGQHMGIRDIEAISAQANAAGMHLSNDIEMPANNRLLMWRRDA
jgi:SAM-dependent methyltransferase